MTIGSAEELPLSADARCLPGDLVCWFDDPAVASMAMVSGSFRNVSTSWSCKAASSGTVV